jgi:hypothetical protein
VGLIKENKGIIAGSASATLRKVIEEGGFFREKAVGFKPIFRRHGL